MAVQGQDKDSVFCERCFAVSPRGTEHCPECGAPIKTTTGIGTGVDATVYPELARANLLRMRHKYKEAEDLCLSILRRYPHNHTANTIMGDIAAEQGDLEQAAEWYELALDIDPDSASDRHKLAAVKHQIETKEVTTTAEQLGLPTERPKTALIASIALGILLLLGVIGYVLSHGRTASAAPSPQQKIDEPLSINPSPTPGPSTDGGGSKKTTGDVPAPTPGEDARLTKKIAHDSTEGAYLVKAEYDLQNDGVLLNYTVPTDKSEELIGAKLAFDAFPIANEILPNKTVDVMELRAVRDGKVFYSARVKRSSFDTTSTDEWQAAHKSDIPALAKVILSDEKWVEGAAPDKPVNGKTTPATTGSTGGGTAGTGSSSVTAGGGGETKTSTTATAGEEAKPVPTPSGPPTRGTTG